METERRTAPGPAPGPGVSTVPRDAWDRAPWNRWSFLHVRDILPTAVVSPGPGPAPPLPRAERNLDDLEVTADGKPATLATYLAQSFTDGFLVLKDGAVVYERYLNGMDAATLHLSQSVAKSFVGALAGILARRRLLDVRAPVTDVLPELKTTAYAGATVRHLLDMTSGVRFTEEYTDPYSDMGRADVASGWKPPPAGADPAFKWPATMFELILTLGHQEREHGAQFSYRSIETDVLAFVLERASGKRLPQLLSEEIWQPLGMEQDGCFTVDPDGFALADGGLNACLRDYARFGQMILEDGAGIVPAAWVDATRLGDPSLFGTPYTAVLPRGAYRNKFWIEDPVKRTLMARGVFGQLIYISWQYRMVAVKLSSWPDFVNPAWTREAIANFHAVGAALSRS